MASSSRTTIDGGAVTKLKGTYQYLDEQKRFHLVEPNEKLAGSIAFGWHFDQETEDAEYHIIHVGKNDEDINARCTLIVPESHLHHELLGAYYQVYHGERPNFHKSPVGFQRLRIVDLNRRLRKLRQGGASAWREKLPQGTEIPTKDFQVIQVECHNDDLLCFRTGMLHAVTGRDEANQLIQTKVYMGTRRRQEDKSLQVSAGVYKNGARKWEQEQHVERKIQDPIQLQGQPMLITTNMQEVLKRHGMIVFPSITGGGKAVFDGLLNYTHQLLNLPAEVDLSLPEHASLLSSSEQRDYLSDLGVTNAHVRRNANNTRSTHFGRAVGISGYGGLSQTVSQLCQIMLPFAEYLYGYPLEVRAQDYALQLPCMQGVPKKKRRVTHQEEK